MAIAGSDKLLSSAMKRVDNAVYQTIADYVNGTFSSGTVLYDLAVDGVGLAPFHETDASIPQEVKDELDAVKQGIIDGAINIDDSCAPPPSTTCGLLPSQSTRQSMVGNGRRGQQLP
jgi:basic membrane protein A